MSSRISIRFRYIITMHYRSIRLRDIPHPLSPNAILYFQLPLIITIKQPPDLVILVVVLYLYRSRWYMSYNEWCLRIWYRHMYWWGRIPVWNGQEKCCEYQGWIHASWTLNDRKWNSVIKFFIMVLVEFLLYEQLILHVFRWLLCPLRQFVCLEQGASSGFWKYWWWDPIFISTNGVMQSHVIASTNMYWWWSRLLYL